MVALEAEVEVIMVAATAEETGEDADLVLALPNVEGTAPLPRHGHGTNR
jgi:hypothetical protein